MVCSGSSDLTLTCPGTVTVMSLSSFPLQDALTNMLRRSQLHFIHCLVPGPQPSGDATGLPPADIPALRIQLAGAHILEALRLHRAGERWPGALVCRCVLPHKKKQQLAPEVMVQGKRDQCMQRQGGWRAWVFSKLCWGVVGCWRRVGRYCDSSIGRVEKTCLVGLFGGST